jgi:hypothetical protein
MEILNTTELRRWAKSRKFPDSWWFSVDGKIVVGPSPVAEIPKEGQVLLMNDAARGTLDEQWLIYRYPGFKTEEERKEKDRIRNQPTIKQIVALEFFGHKGVCLTKAQASDLLDECFQSGHNYGRYQEYVYSNLDRLYSGKELATQCILMLQENLFYIKENISKKRLSDLVDELVADHTPYQNYVDAIRSKYPSILLAESTRQRKISEYEIRNKASSDYHKEENSKRKKGGCLSVTTFFCLFQLLSNTTESSFNSAWGQSRMARDYAC